MAKPKTYPDTTLQGLLTARGLTVRCMWEIPGPKDTQIAWITAYAVNGTVILVQTYSGGNGWEAYLPCQSISVGETVDAVVGQLSAT